MRSIAVAEESRSPRFGSRELFSAGFVALVLLAMTWPTPVVWLNEGFVGASLAVDEKSFLGREAPSWDIVFWCIAGLFALALFHGRIPEARLGWHLFVRDLVALPGNLSARIREFRLWRVLVVFVLAAGVVGSVWMYLDGPLVNVAETIRTDASVDAIRLLNRLGGGMNPVMIVGFFFLCGIVFVVRRWWLIALAMIGGGLSAGLLVQLVKFTVDRSRPELWLGPFHFSESMSSSFPSGHTIGAFALAAAVVFGSRSAGLRALAIILAVAIGVSRVIAFRHWPSDVVASGLIGSFAGWFFADALRRLDQPRLASADRLPARRAARSYERAAGAVEVEIYASRSANETDTSREQPASSIVTP